MEPYYVTQAILDPGAQLILPPLSLKEEGTASG